MAFALREICIEQVIRNEKETWKTKEWAKCIGCHPTGSTPDQTDKGCTYCESRAILLKLFEERGLEDMIELDN